MTATWLVGDVLEQLASIPAGSVDLAVYSPPFLNLREYLDEDHPRKAFEDGRERSPIEFIDRQLDVVEAVGRALAPHGSIAVELGDTSVVRGKRIGVVPSRGRDRHDLPRRSSDGPGWALEKSLSMIPEAFRLALAYGFNPLRPERTTPKWKIRNVIPWCRTNPPPGRLGDKFRRGHTTIVVATKSNRRWFDDFEVREPYRDPRVRSERNRDPLVRGHGQRSSEPIATDGPGAPLLDWWVLTSRTHQSDHGEHFAAFPEELARRLILSMCPPRVCTMCGVPVRRLIRPSADYQARLGQSIFPKNVGDSDRMKRGRRGAHKDIVAINNHVGWAECRCPEPDRFRPGLVLDAYAGTGTSLAVASRFGRDAVGIDLDESNVPIVAGRIPGLILR